MVSFRNTCLIVLLLITFSTTAIAQEESPEETTEESKVTLSTLIDGISVKGPGAAFSSGIWAFSASKLNNYLESRHYQEINSINTFSFTGYWTFVPRFHLGVGLSFGTTDFLERRVVNYIQNTTSIHSVQMEVASLYFSAAYKHTFWKNRIQWYAGADVGLYSLRLTLEKTVLNQQTYKERYKAAAPGVSAKAGIQYEFNKLFGIGLDIGYIGVVFEDVELANVEVQYFPDIKLGGVYSGLSFTIHL